MANRNFNRVQALDKEVKFLFLTATIGSGGDPTLVFEPITPQVKIYRDTDDNIFVKPNEILSQNSVPSGNYRLRFDFLKNTKIDIF